MLWAPPEQVENVGQSQSSVGRCLLDPGLSAVIRGAFRPAPLVPVPEVDITSQRAGRPVGRAGTTAEGGQEALTVAPEQHLLWAELPRPQ